MADGERPSEPSIERHRRHAGVRRVRGRSIARRGICRSRALRLGDGRPAFWVFVGGERSVGWPFICGVGTLWVLGDVLETVDGVRG